MKMRLIIAVLALFTLSSTSQAQVDVTINPLGILFGNISVGADIVITENFSVEPTVGFGARTRELLGYKSTRIPISVFGKYYFNPNNGADKFYASLWLRYSNRKFEWDETFAGAFNVNYNQTRIGGGLGIGYKVVSSGGVVFDIGFGAGRAFVDNTTFNSDVDDQGLITIDWPALMFNGKLGLGYRFGG